MNIVLLKWYQNIAVPHVKSTDLSMNAHKKVRFTMRTKKFGMPNESPGTHFGVPHSYSFRNGRFVQFSHLTC